MRGRRETIRASCVLLLASLTAALALPGSGGADPALDARALRAQDASLGTRIHGALLDLYSLDAKLTNARARAASLAAQADTVRAQLVLARRDKAIAGRAWRASVGALASHLRTLYENGQPDAVAVLLGATSIDDAMTRLDELERTARMNRDAIVQTQRARVTLSRLQLSLARREQQLQTLVAGARQATAQLEQTRADRSTYVARLTGERAFNERRIASLEAQARASAATTPATRQAQAEGVPTATAAAPSTAAAASTPATAAPTPQGATLVVTATGYSLPGRTSTGLPTGWGVVAVDPSVIPLGTHLSIPGYGEGVAADTGGGVQGAAIDLWFPSTAQATAWGRRTVTISLH